MKENTLYIIYEKEGVFGKPQKGLKLPILNPEMIEYVRGQDMYFIPDKRIIGMLYRYPGEYEIKEEGIQLHNPYFQMDTMEEELKQDERLENVTKVKDELYYKCEYLQQQYDRLQESFRETYTDLQRRWEQDQNRIKELIEALNGLYDHTPDLISEIPESALSPFDHSLRAAIIKAKKILKR